MPDHLFYSIRSNVLYISILWHAWECGWLKCWACSAHSYTHTQCTQRVYTNKPFMIIVKINFKRSEMCTHSTRTHAVYYRIQLKSEPKKTLRVMRTPHCWVCVYFYGDEVPTLLLLLLTLNFYNCCFYKDILLYISLPFETASAFYLANGLE